MASEEVNPTTPIALPHASEEETTPHPAEVTAELVHHEDVVDLEAPEVTLVPAGQHPLSSSLQPPVPPAHNEPEHGNVVVTATTVDPPTAATTTATTTQPTTTTTTTPLRRAEFSSTTVFKTANTDLGITLQQDGGLIQITAMDANSILQNSPLSVGDYLLSVNGKTCADLDSCQQVLDLLRLLQGAVTLTGHTTEGDSQKIETCVEKPAHCERVGLVLRQVTHQDTSTSLVVSRIPADGLFVQSLLNVGDRIVSINGIDCRNVSAHTALEMIRSTPRFVTIVTESLATTGVAVSVASSQLGRYEFREQTCFCVWMIILSLLMVGVGIYKKNE